jgi:S-formylglutathione hydrolase FrmB
MHASPLILSIWVAAGAAGGGTWQVERSAVAKPATSARVLTYVPAACSLAHRCPLVLCLHGWDDRPESFRDQTDIAPLADRHGFVLAMPEMGKSVYEAAYYPETQTRWGLLPGARWVGEVVLPQMRAKLPVLGDRAHTAILGFSTGGRGAIVVSARYPEFAAAASLSGTYDLEILAPSTGEYRIHAAVFGERRTFLHRWTEEDANTPSNLEALKRVALFIGHGARDPAVPLSQARDFEQALLDSEHPSYRVVIDSAAGHSFAYWNSALPAALEAIARRFAAPLPERTP